MILAVLLFVAQPGLPLQSAGSWITNDDYPREAMRRHEEGTASFTLQIDANGQVTGCEITHSSGFKVLDDATCATLMRRARFNPAKDDQGHPKAGTFSSKMRWLIAK